MRPGERIRLIKEATESLRAHPWSEIQLTLREFGIDTFDLIGWDSPGVDEYCTERLGTASNDVLSELHEFLFGEDASSVGLRRLDPESLWSSNLPGRVFLCHTHDQRSLVTDVKMHLGASYGIDAFVAHDDISPSHEWRNTIKLALTSCHMMAAFVLPGFHESQWCDQEVGWCLARGIPILPVRPVGFDRSNSRDGFLEEHQDICLDEVRGTVSRWIAFRIFLSLMAHSKTREVGVRVLAEAFVHSGSFDTTRRLWSLIEQQPVIENDQLRRLEYAVQTNRQVYEAVAGADHRPVPELVDELVKRLEPPSTSSLEDEEPF